MRRLAVTVALVLLLAQPPAPGAQPLDPTAAQALAATLAMLLDPAQRAAAIAGHPQGATADARMRALTGSDALTHELYALAADIFRELTEATGGDPARMSDTLARGAADPATFAGMLNPQTLARLRELSAKIGDHRR
jgi:hypothetical protein